MKKLKVKRKTGTAKVSKVRKLKAPEMQPKRGRDGGNEEFRKLSDEYRPEVVSESKILVKEYKSQKGGNVKVYLTFKVQRYDKDDAMGLPNVFIQMYQESEKEEGYTGFLKGKSVHFPLEMMYEVLDALTELSDTCDLLKIE